MKFQVRDASDKLVAETEEAEDAILVMKRWGFNACISVLIRGRWRAVMTNTGQAHFTKRDLMSNVTVAEVAARGVTK